MITPFEMAVSSVRVGVGVKREVGMDLKELGTKLAMVVTDPIVVKLSPVRTTIESLEQNGIAYALYNRVRVEPSDESFLDLLDAARLNEVGSGPSDSSSLPALTPSTPTRARR